MPPTLSSNAPVSVSPGDSAPPLPHVKMLAVKPPPVMIATTDELIQRSTQEGGAAPSIPTPQTSMAPKTSAQAVGPAPAAPAAWPDAPLAAATIKTQEPSAVPTGARADFARPKADARASDDAESTARGGKVTTNARMADSLTATPMGMFLILSIGLAVAGALSRVVMKIARARRAPLVIGHPESDWIDDQNQHEWSNDQGHGTFDEQQEDPSLISSANDCTLRHPFPADDEWPDNALDVQRTFQITSEISKREVKLAQLSQHLDRLLRSPRAA
jgi:hypothetical protein